LHCWSSKGVEKKKSGDGIVVLQLLCATGAPTLKMVDVPPEPNPVASDIVSRNCVPSLNENCDIEYEPLPLLNADAGTDMLFSGWLGANWGI
jgi:hypothetical protein